MLNQILHRRRRDLARLASRGRRDDPRITQAQQVPVLSQKLGVPEYDAPRLARRDGKDPRTQYAVTHQLDEGRVLLSAHDLLVDRPGPLGRKDLAAKLLLAHEEREVRENRLRRYRVQVVAFHQRARAVAKLFIDLNPRDPAIAIDRDRHVAVQALNGGVGQPAVSVGLDPPLRVRRRRGGQ